MRRPGPAAFLWLLLAVSVRAQQPYIETFEVRLHNLDVVVTDAGGKSVRGLTRSDFVVLEDGKSQTITNFAAYDVEAGKATAVPAASATPVAEPGASPPPPRRFVFFVDEIGLQKATRERLAARAIELARAMRGEDRVTIVRPTNATDPVQEFVGPGPALEKALRTAIDESGVRMAAGNFPEVYEFQRALSTGRSVAEWRYARRAYADAARRRVGHRLGQIRVLANSLAATEGRKVLVVISMGLLAQPGREAWDYEEQTRVLQSAGGPEDPESESDDPERVQAEDPGSESDDPERVQAGGGIVGDLMPDIEDIARNAAANGVTIYAIEPEVPLTLFVKGRADIPPKVDPLALHFSSDPRAELPPEFESELLQNSAATLTELSETTGGRWFRGMTGIDDAFRQVSEDLSVYYSLAYHADGEPDRPRSVTVQVRNHPEMRARTRTAVMERSVEREMDGLVVAALLYPRPVNELGIEVTSGHPQRSRGFFVIPIQIAIPMERLTFLPVASGERYVAVFNVHFAAAGLKSDFVSGGARGQEVEISKEQYETIGGTIYRYKTGMEVAPGRARISIGVLEETSLLTGFRTLEVVAE